MRERAHVLLAGALLVLVACWQSALIDAVAANDAAKVERLLSEGADPNVRGNDGWTPLSVAARDGHSDLVRILLDAGADINRPEGGGNTPLFWAAHSGNLEIVLQLLKRGARSNLKCAECVLPADAAADQGHQQVADLIRKSGRE
jgi:ankyrin repeat protein